MARLKVFYGLRKLTKKAVRKPSIIVIYENCEFWKNNQKVNQMMKVLHVREQTKGEQKDGLKCNRTLMVYEMQFLHNKYFQNSPEKAIRFNSEADKNNVSKKERNEIAEKLRKEVYRFYKVEEPLYGWQKEIDFK